MKCPVHKTDMKVKDSEKVTVNTNGVKKKEPLFHCRECKRYYLYDSNILPAQAKRTKATYHEEPVYKCSIKYRATVDDTDSIWKKKTCIFHLSRVLPQLSVNGIETKVLK